MTTRLPIPGQDNGTWGDSQVTSGGTPDATTSTKGKLQLAGDLSGTAARRSEARTEPVGVTHATLFAASYT